MNKILLSIFALVLTLALHAQSTNPAPYCSAAFDDQQGFPVDDHIDRVKFDALDNASNAQYAYPHYVLYNNLSVPNYVKGSTYTLKAKFTVAGSAGYGVWIDFNHNNTFESNEMVSGTSGTNYLHLVSDSISVNVLIPATATAGNTRMRVRIVEDDNYHAIHGASELACNADTTAANVMDWGETEDYVINIVNASTGIEEARAISEIVLYPNPAHDLLQIMTTRDEHQYSYRIISISGQILDKNTLTGSQSIDVSMLADGLYFCIVTDSSTMMEQVLKFEKTKE